MSLIDCPDCGKEISKSAKSCPNCGCEITKPIIEKQEKILKNHIIYMQKKKAIEEEWKEAGHSMLTYDIKDLSLTQDEIKELFKKNILSKNLYSIFDNNEPSTKDENIKHQINNCKDSNVFMMFEISAGEYLLFTDNFLIICSQKIYFNPSKYETNMKFPLVIPYCKVSKIEILNGNNVSMMFEPEYKIKTGDIAKGAMIGAMIGGTTGAIIGASANLPKKVMTSPAKYYNVDFYKININFKGKKTLKFNLFGFDKSDYTFVDDVGGEDVRIINNKLLNSMCSPTKLNSADEINNLLNEYSEKYKEVINSAIDYKKREYCINFIYNNISNKEKIFLYDNKKDFFKTINNIFKDVNEDKFMTIKENLNNISNDIIRQNNEKNKILNDINKLNSNYEALSNLKFIQKSKIKNQINELEQQLQLFKYYEHPDITYELYNELKSMK